MRMNDPILPSLLDTYPVALLLSGFRFLRSYGVETGCHNGTGPFRRAMKAGLYGSVLPTVVAVSLVMLATLSGLLMLWERERIAFLREQRFRQARADVESAYTLYRLHPDDGKLTAVEGYRLSDSLPHSRVRIRRESWGLYEAVHVAVEDSLVVACRLMGVRPDPEQTLYYADNRIAVTLAGRTELQGVLHLPQNGAVYGRMGADFFRGREIPRAAFRRSGAELPHPDVAVINRLDSLFTAGKRLPQTGVPDSLAVPFHIGETVSLRVGDADVGGCILMGRIVLHAGELRIDSTCRTEHLVVIARKIVVGRGTRIAAQLFARDTVVVEPRAVLEYPSGIWCGQYTELQEQSEVNGYVVVRDTVRRNRLRPCYRQSRTARLRGLLRTDGMAHVQGIVAGCAVLRRAVYFAPQGYYKDMFYDCTLLGNPETALPIGLGTGTERRKEAVWVE